MARATQLGVYPKLRYTLKCQMVEIKGFRNWAISKCHIKVFATYETLIFNFYLPFHLLDMLIINHYWNIAWLTIEAYTPAIKLIVTPQRC